MDAAVKHIRGRVKSAARRGDDRVQVIVAVPCAIVWDIYNATALA